MKASRHAAETVARQPVASAARTNDSSSGSPGLGLQAAIDQSPRALAQRRAIEAAFRPPLQRMMEDDSDESDDEGKSAEKKPSGTTDSAEGQGAQKSAEGGSTSGTPSAQGVPTYTLQVRLAAKNKFNVTVNSSTRGEVSTVSTPKAGLAAALSRFVTSYTTSFLNKAKAGKETAEMAIADAKRTQELQALIEKQEATQPAAVTTPSEEPVDAGEAKPYVLANAMKELEALGKLKTEGTGHEKIQMRSYELPKAVYLTLGGQRRKMTHLYTQMGNKAPGLMELRFYLGTEAGAIQRVHTSITVQKDKLSAHTMVQTDKDVAVPFGSGFLRKPGAPTGKPARVGYDITDITGGLSKGKSKSRDRDAVSSKGRFAVDEPKGGEAKAVEWLRDHFNSALDKALANLPKTEETKSKLYSNSSKVLDWDWESDAGAKPHVHHYEKSREKATKREKPSTLVGPSTEPETAKPKDQEESFDDMPPLEPADPLLENQGEATGEQGHQNSEPDTHPMDLPGRILGGMAAEIEQGINQKELAGDLSAEDAAALREALRKRVDALIMTSVEIIANDPTMAEGVVRRGLTEMQDIQQEFM